ncbi:MAG: diaminopimelate decarboxylase, partial [Alphaproteobacteria bacterium]|nr:diaminopimelate decarboxylase [Alphaproteobacteria bacterium]
MDHFAYHRGVLHAEDVPIPAIAEAVGTPFYCYSTATLERHYKVFTEAFSTNPNTLTCYAVKANVNLAVIKTLALLGAGADTVSQGEIMLARKAGVPGDKIVFSGVGKTEEEIAYGLKEKILQF